MALYKLKDFYPNYREELFDGNDIKGIDIYTERDEKVGSVHDVLVDDEGHFRYLVMDTGFWIFGKKVLLPVGRCESDPRAQRLYLKGLTKDQAEHLPEYHDDITVDYHYEERVRDVYRRPGVETSRPRVEMSGPLETATPVESSMLVEATYTKAMPGMVNNQPAYNRDTYNYQMEPSLYEMSDRNHQTIKLYEERLVANKHRRKAGDVTIGKHVESETARVAVPVEKERVVIERNPNAMNRAVSPTETDFREGEIARMEVYEETANIHKEAFVREQVNIRKEVDRDTVSAEDTVRREELDIDSGGLPIRSQDLDRPSDRRI